MASKDKPLSKLKQEERNLVESFSNDIAHYDLAGVRKTLPLITERNLLNYSKSYPMELTFLNTALSSGIRNKDAAELLILAGPDLTIGDYRKVTPLMKAATFDLSLTLKLLELGADCSARDLGGLTALHHSVSSVLAECEILLALINAGADVNARENAGRTPLHSAAASIDANKIRYLLQIGADPTIRASGTLGTPFEYLAETVGARPNKTAADREECLDLLRVK